MERATGALVNALESLVFIAGRLASEASARDGGDSRRRVTSLGGAIWSPTRATIGRLDIGGIMTALAERDAAELLRQLYGVEDVAELRTPIDPIAVAQALGVEVYLASFDDDVAGLLRKRPSEEPEIYLNRDNHPNRRRFTCAHEIGHYIRRSSEAKDYGGDTESWSFIDRRNQLSSRGTAPAEVYANSFAAGLLMPEGSVRRKLTRFGPVGLNTQFGVSVEAMNYRLRNLGLMTG